MNKDPVPIDPTDPLFSYQTDGDPMDAVRDGFHEARDHFPLFMDLAVAVQISEDLASMADIRFRHLFDPIRDAVVEAAERYDTVHPNVKRHQPHGESALPSWEIVMGIELDSTLLVDDATVQRRVEQHGMQPQAGMETRSPLPTTHSPVIKDVELAALYHSYHAEDEPCEIVCSHMDEEFLEYEYCLFIQQRDLNDFYAPPLYMLDSDTYRGFLVDLMDAKVNLLMEASETWDVRSVFEGYAAPLVHTVNDYNRMHGEERSS